MTLQNRFSHIYMESAVKQHSLTQEIKKKHPNSTFIEVNNYKAIFNRANQNPALQRKSQNLILAEKRENFVHPASFFIQNFANYGIILYILQVLCFKTLRKNLQQP